MQMLSLIGAITAIVVMCVLAFRKMNPFIISLIGTIILVVCSGMSVLGSIFGTYTPSVGEFCGNWILVFILGSIYGKLLEITGIAKRLAATLVNLESIDVSYSFANRSTDKRTAMITAEVRTKQDLNKLDEFFSEACRKDNMLYIRGL